MTHENNMRLCAQYRMYFIVCILPVTKVPEIQCEMLPYAVILLPVMVPLYGLLDPVIAMMVAIVLLSLTGDTSALSIWSE